jgi:hypothetical protein
VKLDENFKNINFSNEKILKEIKNQFEHLCTSTVKVNVIRVDKTNEKPFVISNIFK